MLRKIVVLQTQFGVLNGQLVAFVAVGVLGLECVKTSTMKAIECTPFVSVRLDGLSYIIIADRSPQHTETRKLLRAWDTIETVPKP